MENLNKNSTLYTETAARIVAASSAGIKGTVIADAAGVPYRKISHIVLANAGTPYVFSPNLSAIECAAINAAIDQIKSAI